MLASCFSRGEETIHHWNSFAQGPAGCRIDFHLPTLISSIAAQQGIRHGLVSYRKLHQLGDRDLSAQKRPFIKRWPYRIEEEYRIIFESTDPRDADRTELSLPIPMDSIRSITLSQDMPAAVFKSIKTQLKPKLGRRISHSTLLEKKAWINKFKGSEIPCPQIWPRHEIDQKF